MVKLTSSRNCRSPFDHLRIDCSGIYRVFTVFMIVFALKVFKGSSLVDQNRRVAESILRFFPGFHAFCLPPPTHDPEVVIDMRRHESQVNPEFLSRIKTFKEFLRTTLIPKRSFKDGEIVTGEGTAFVVK